MLINPIEHGITEYLGDAYPTLSAYATLLASEGVRRGLIGPREVDRIWERHIVNCAAVVPLLPRVGVVIDVGSGAGLPAVVLAAMRTDLSVIALEPMLRRVRWLEELVRSLALPNLAIVRGRAEELHGQLFGDAVTARAVAPLDRLVRWCLPLVSPGGELLALKGQRVESEIAQARAVLIKYKCADPEVLQLQPIAGIQATVVVRIPRP